MPTMGNHHDILWVGKTPKEIPSDTHSWPFAAASSFMLHSSKC